MNVPGMENINKLENILMDVVSRRFERESSVPTLTPSEMKAAEILTEIFRLRADMGMHWLQEESWKTSEQIHEAFAESELVHESKRSEDKFEIIRALSRALMMTRAGENILYIVYEADHEEVQIKFVNGYEKHVNVECDSGVAMIRDVVNAL